MKKWQRRLLLHCLSLAIALAVVSWLLPVERVEQAFRDLRFRVRAHWTPEPPHPDILLVTTDARSLEQVKMPLSFWPLVYSEAIARLVEAGAKVIAPDLLWQLDPSSVRELGPGSEQLEEQLLAEEVRTALLVGSAPVVVGAHRDRGQLNLPQDSLLAMGGDRVALLNLSEESDGVVRRQSLASLVPVGSEVQEFPSFSARAAELAGASELRAVPVDRDELFWINYRGPHGSFRTVSLVDLLETEDLAQFHDKLVFLGSYDARLHDVRRSPFSKDGAPDMFGVEIHAHAAATLLDRNFLRPLNPAVELLANLVMAAGIAVAFTFASPPLALLGAALLLALWWLLALWAFIGWGVWLGMAGKLLLVFLTCVGCYILRYLQVERARKLATTLFGRYAPAAVVDQLLDDPALAKLGGRSAEVTLLFCDIDGFSTISEQVEPRELIGLINEFFTEMAAIIHRHGGVIRQFVGDEIMVIFGAPSPMTDHAEAAVRTAVESVRRLRELEQERGGALGFYRMKTGIHTGQVVCGNVGSEERMEYTAVGDDVNLASRVMGLNSVLKTEILITQETRERLGDSDGEYRVTPLGRRPVKGRDGEVELYEIRWEDRQE